MDNKTDKNSPAVDSQGRAEVDTYDRGIVPAETAARKEREGSAFKQHPTEASQQQARNDDETDSNSIKTTEGYTSDKEGLINNYAIEPEMYVDEPGDLREKEAQLKAERTGEINEANQDKDGQLSMEHDSRGKGPGMI
ncbi:MULTISPECIES: hypothetical protein [Trichocoleus]|uniref:Uncharacterized protein n=1 Tax=Trichocoleus desertorum GB2-A4 TaxID=2933944 RepID=A0ABV0J460_9CYAN|nr:MULTISPECIES: hypothetical protein [unclassified Trichocoleus]MBD1861884.1 hypothetical protein [Trichocoleus sp. FACHB-46]MBD2098122.1 hypothetical protein [Trichocoleus sp. FACHB-591]MBD2123056.1 hypothetical protein [Trichocoleus sp. FACHB-262]